MNGNLENIINILGGNWHDYADKVRSYYEGNIQFENYLWAEFSNCEEWINNERKLFINLNLINSFYGAGIGRGNEYRIIHKIFSGMLTNILERRDQINADFIANEERMQLYKKIGNVVVNDIEKHSYVAPGKFLHFCNPQLFPIFDNKVAKIFGIGQLDYNAVNEVVNYIIHITDNMTGRMSELRNDIINIGISDRISEYTVIDKILWLNESDIQQNIRAVEN